MIKTDIDLTTLGLTSAEVGKSREKNGHNVLTPPKRPSMLKLYLDKYNDSIIRILLFTALLSLGIGIYEHDFVETSGILLAILLATSIGFYFEYDAARRFDVLNALGQEEMVSVVRNGAITQIPRSEIVVGDVVILEQGIEVPADGILIKTINLKVDESSLTGEPVCNKTSDPAKLNDESTYPVNRVLRSSMVVEGHGIMKVEQVGDATEIGKVARQATLISYIKTPLNIQLGKLAKVINHAAFIISLLVFVICSITGIIHYLNSFHYQPENTYIDIAQILLHNFMLAVTLIVMAVPEGLPMAVTLSLALNMRRMLKTNNLVRKMHACETMGAITVICTDKTGTLTQNRMEVAEIRYENVDEKILYENIAVNSTAHLAKGDKLTGLGNPTESALLLYLHKVGVDYARLRRNAIVESQLPFSAERKLMATVVRSTLTDERILYVKGAPEVVITRCKVREILLKEAGALLKGYQHAAMRTLAFACLPLSESDGGDIEALVERGGWRFTGIAAIMDPVRAEVPEAVRTCVDAGIQVKIVTGDNEGTATEIARRIGLWKESDTKNNRITGPAFASLTDEEALQRVKKLKIMSRARPMDKQRLVQLLQKSGEVVAVTGDGTNDAPALNFAQVGLSMGSGTSVAKEASDITLVDDSFGSIVTAVMWGRSLYKNIQRFIGFQLTISLTALIITLAGSLIGTEMPLTVTQILWINLIIDTFASLALSTIPPSSSVMKEKPRKASEFIVSRSLLRSIIVTTVGFCLFLSWLILRCDSTVFSEVGIMVTPHELTVIFTSFVMLQFWNLLNAKAWDSGRSAFADLCHCNGLLLVLTIILVCQVLIVQFGGAVFRTEALSVTSWLKIFFITSFVLWIGEIIRFFNRKKTA